MSEKTYFGCIDYRNAKFQGLISDEKPEGIGFIFDINHLLAFTSWKNDLPYGNALIIFSNGNYIYGKIKNKKWEGIAIFSKYSG
jgi:hypothetical protein